MTESYDAGSIERLASELRGLGDRAREAGHNVYATLVISQAENLIAESPFHRQLPEPPSHAAGIAAGIVALHGSELAGRRRLQCLAYLLHRYGAALDLQFEYYEGPFSPALARGLDEALNVRLIDHERRVGRHGIRHSYFSTLALKPETIGKLSVEEASTILEVARPFSRIRTGDCLRHRHASR